MKNILILLLIVFFPTSADAGHYEDAVKAFEKGDCQKSVREFHKAADEGHVVAQSKLGHIYFLGLCNVDKSHEEGIKWWRNASYKGNADALTQLGLVYMNGLGIKKDMEEGAKYLSQAAAQGYAIAQFNLGVYYNEKGRFFDASRYIVSAAKQGYQRAIEVARELGVREMPPLPGQSMADAQLVKDALPAALVAAKAAIDKNCKLKEYKITNTEIVNEPEFKEINGDEKMIYMEVWYAELCGKAVAIPVLFVTSMTGKGTTYSINDGDIKILN